MLLHVHINTPPPPPSTQSLQDAGSLAQELWNEKTSSPLGGSEWKLAAVSVIRSHLRRGEETLSDK